jgi:hypothetical protein
MLFIISAVRTSDPGKRKLFVHSFRSGIFPESTWKKIRLSRVRVRKLRFILANVQLCRLILIASESFKTDDIISRS